LSPLLSSHSTRQGAERGKRWSDIRKEERKAAVMRKLLPPENRTVREVAEEEGISKVTLYNWRKRAREQG